MPLVINEVDYDQPGADGASFIEIYNSGTTAVSLAGIYVVLVNGSNNLPYLSIELSSGGASVLGPGEYFVICNATVVVAAGAQAIIVADDFIQNGAPDGIALVDTNTSTLIDSLSYEGSIVADLTSLGLGSSVNLVNGTATTAADENANDVSLIRSPNGRDTNNDASDWSVSFSITPGSSNTPQADIFTAAANVVDLNLFDLSLYDFDQVTDALGGGDEVTLSSTQFVGVAFHGGAGNDTITGTNATDVIHGGADSDILRGGNGNDTLNGDDGNDFLYGQNDNDTLNGGEGNDTLNGQTGADTMTGGNGNDTYFLDNVGDIVNEAIGTGVDTTDTVVTSVNFRQDLMTSARGVEYIVVTGTGNVTIVAMETFNVITGNSGNNYIAGYGGNDTIDAGAGTDFVFGGDGRDLLTGGLGNDTFYYSFVADSGGTINRRDTITDFGQTAGNDDVIDLRPLDAISFNSGLQHFTWLDTGAFTGAHGELRYFYDAVNNLTIIEGNTFGDTAPEFQLALVGNYTLTAGAAGLGHDILIV